MATTLEKFHGGYALPGHCAVATDSAQAARACLRYFEHANLLRKPPIQACDDAQIGGLS
jgi:hypothetical protein